MTIAHYNVTPRSKYVKVEVFASPKEMEEFRARLEAESGVSYDVTVYPADATDAKIPENQSWAGGDSYTVVAQGTVV